MEQPETTRQLKVGRQLQRDLAEIFQQQGMSAYNGVMITVTSVRMSPDLAFAKVWLSIFPSDKGSEVLELLQKQVKTIRGALGRRVAKQLRIVPELVFMVDDSLDYVERIDALLRS
ncbi:MAG: 30S ribosome-binding factor RbfA [Bacteroidetes bacterium]|nr:30S ribosome-binding factor RbfA [Bacteroidota bacterium]